MNEWLKGYGGVVAHGFVALQGIASEDEARDVFKKIDDNGGGILLLDEWCFFLKNCEIAADTAIGKLLALDEAGGVGKKEALFANTMAKPRTPSTQRPSSKDEKKSSSVSSAAPSLRTTTTANAKSTTAVLVKTTGAKSPKTFLKRGNSTPRNQAPSKTAVELQADLKEWLNSKQAAAASTVPANAFGLAVGATASVELTNFIGVFEPLAAETPEGEALREMGFVAADPNGAL